ncbi:hypothetical protein Pfo_025450 [Paulownia fortunei]|nr:hypothetical protein Pfo_025450 [Paulownia fortunei]
MKSLILMARTFFSLSNNASTAQILSKSNLGKCEEVSDSNGLNCTSNIVLELAIPMNRTIMKSITLNPEVSSFPRVLPSLMVRGDVVIVETTYPLHFPELGKFAPVPTCSLILSRSSISKLLLLRKNKSLYILRSHMFLNGCAPPYGRRLALVN